jgi:hypothetical protein
MDEAARRRVTGVLGQVEADIASRDGNEPWEARLELVLPFLPEPEPLVPLNRPRGIRHTKNRHNLFVHAQSLGDPKNRLPHLGQRAGMSPEPSRLASFTGDGGDMTGHADRSKDKRWQSR